MAQRRASRSFASRLASARGWRFPWWRSRAGRPAAGQGTPPPGVRPRVEVLEDRTLLSFAAPLSVPTGANPTSVAVGDFNGDGKADLAAANLGDATVSVLLGNGDGSFRTGASLVVGAGPLAVAVGDFKGD